MYIKVLKGYKHPLFNESENKENRRFDKHNNNKYIPFSLFFY